MQWLLRNTRVHNKRKRGLTEEEHNSLLHKIEKLLWTDPENFLPDDLNLLEGDFGALGRARTFDQKLRVTEVEASMSAAKYAALTIRRSESVDTQHPSGDNPNNMIEPVVLTIKLGSEGRGAWRKKYCR